MEVFAAHEVCTKVHIEEAWAVTGKALIGTKWIDINRSDDIDPEYRSRSIAQEIKRNKEDDLFAATPTIEATRAMFSLATTGEFGIGKKKKKSTMSKLKLLFVDVR